MIHLTFSDDGLARIRALGLPTRNPIKLRWTDRHPLSSYGLGVLLMGHSGEVLDGARFGALAENFDARIETFYPLEYRRVMGALGSLPAKLSARVMCVRGAE